ncbi:MAG: putative toxin-antitoxin system toxin component, PIN family [Caldilineaceae bacterium]
MLDTDVIVAGLRSPSGASAAILKAADAGMIQLLVTVTLALEYEAQCTAPEHRDAAKLTLHEAGNFVNAIIRIAEPVEPHFLWRPQLRDPGDEMVLEAAINGKADAIVTFNLRDYGTVPAQFGIEIYPPSHAIRRIRQ